MANPVAVSLHALGATTASGTGATVDLLEDSEGEGAARKALKLTLDVRAATGTNRVLKVEVETSPDQAAWTVLHTVNALHQAAVLELVIGGAQRYIRAKHTVAGSTPSFTWSLLGHAHVVYCEPADIVSDAVPEAALSGLGIDERWKACLAVSDEADGYVGGAYTLPLLAWGGDLRSKCAEMAAARLFRKRGCDPMGPDKIVFDTEATARTWLNRLANGNLSPPGIVDSTEDVFEGGSVVVSSGSPRGW